ncbi:MAG: hypothetical protein ACOY93_05895 [Bacillota bacterium]
MRNLTALGIKFGTAFFVLAVWGQASGGPTPGKAAVIALFVAGLSWAADRLLPFTLQGVTRWAIDGGLAGLTIYGAQFLWPGPGIDLFSSLLLGFGLGALELPIHFFLASRYGLRRPEDDRDGVR